MGIVDQMMDTILDMFNPFVTAFYTQDEAEKVNKMTTV